MGRGHTEEQFQFEPVVRSGLGFEFDPLSIAMPLFRESLAQLEGLNSAADWEAAVGPVMADKDARETIRARAPEIHEWLTEAAGRACNVNGWSKGVYANHPALSTAVNPFVVIEMCLSAVGMRINDPAVDKMVPRLDRFARKRLVDVVTEIPEGAPVDLEALRYQLALAYHEAAAKEALRVFNTSPLETRLERIAARPNDPLVTIKMYELIAHRGQAQELVRDADTKALILKAVCGGGVEPRQTAQLRARFALGYGLMQDPWSVSKAVSLHLHATDIADFMRSTFPDVFAQAEFEARMNEKPEPVSG